MFYTTDQNADQQHLKSGLFFIFSNFNQRNNQVDNFKIYDIKFLKGIKKYKKEKKYIDDMTKKNITGIVVVQNGIKKERNERK